MVFADAHFPTGIGRLQKVGSIALLSAAGHEHCKTHSWQLPPETNPYQLPSETSPYQSQTAAGSGSPRGTPAQTGPMGLS